MTTEPYTPDEAELIGCYAEVMEEHAGENYDTAKADAERGIAKIRAKARAEAWDELSSALEDEVSFSVAAEYPNPYREQDEA